MSVYIDTLLRVSAALPVHLRRHLLLIETSYLVHIFINNKLDMYICGNREGGVGTTGRSFVLRLHGSISRSTDRRSRLFPKKGAKGKEWTRRYRGTAGFPEPS